MLVPIRTSAAAGKYEIRVSTDGTTFPTTATSAGTWADTAALKQVDFAARSARAVRITAITEAGGRGPWSSAAEINVLSAPATPPPPPPSGDAGDPLPRTGWTATADSEETVREDNKAANVLDGSAATFWHSKWDGTPDPLPHSITINMGGTKTIAGLTYLPRPGGGGNGNIGAPRTLLAACYVAQSLRCVFVLAAQCVIGTAYPRLSSCVIYHARSACCAGAPVSGLCSLPTHVKLLRHAELRAGKYEIRLSRDGNTFPTAATATGTWVDSAALKTVTFASAQARAVRLTGTTEAGGRGPWSAAAEINILAGTGGSTGGPAPTGSLLTRVGWTAAADSEETAREDNKAFNVLDGDVATFWHTKWGGTPAPLPHQITITMGGVTQQTTGLAYTPRPAADKINGNIGARTEHIDMRVLAASLSG